MAVMMNRNAADTMPSRRKPAIDTPTHRATATAVARPNGEETSGMADQRSRQCEGESPVCLRNQRAK